jgi:uncharacterized protein (TIGR02145 family)
MNKKGPIYFSIIVVISALVVCCNKEDKPPDPVPDYEGNIYKTVRIGNQIWMAENLKSTLFNEGSEIPLVTNSTEWRDISTSAYCWYNNDDLSNKSIYGALYNGYATATGKLCPVGWHIPNHDEWEQLRISLGDTITGGSKLKETGTTHWITNKDAVNSVGFVALPAGIRYFEGSFTAISHFTGFWSSSEFDTNSLWYLSLYAGDAYVIMNKVSKNYGLSVRCIKDQ